MTSRQSTPQPTIHPFDLVHKDGGTTMYDVLAVSRPLQEALLREHGQDKGGEWAAIESLTPAKETNR